MKTRFDNQVEQYPIVLLPDKISNNIFKGVLFTESELYANVRRPLEAKIYALDPLSHKQTKIFGNVLKNTIDEQPVKWGNPVVYINDQGKKKFDWKAFVGMTIEAYSYGLVLGFFIFFIFLENYRNSELENFLLSWLIGGTIVYAFFMSMEFISIDDIRDFKKNQKEYAERQLRQKERYRELDKIKLDISKKVDSEYNKKVKEYKTKMEVIKYMECLKPTHSAKRSNSPNKRGAVELNFLEIANEKVKGAFHADMTINNKNYSNQTYHPDLTFICPNTKFHIDIEIDEPYSLKTNQPIHYIGNDEKRNEFFLESGWCVVRFTEKQVVSSPIECLSTIRSIYESVKKSSETYYCFLEKENTWTYENSLIMSKNKYRQEYL